MIYTILVILAIIVSILLIIVVLLQNSKGGGLAANFASGNQVFGVRQTADLLEKTTWTLAILLAVFCFFATINPPAGSGVSTEKSTIQKMENQVPSTQNNAGFPIEKAQPTTQPAAPTTENQQPAEQKAE